MTPLSRIPVFFDARMIAHPVSSASPSAGKPGQVVASWQAAGLPLDIREFAPVTPAMLKRAHAAEYVDDVLACRTRNGFGDRSAQVAASLPWTSGAMLAAAREAIANGQVACAPCSGFHHAHHGHAYGYCTFNGLMVSALELLATGEARQVGILDADQHFGDGTEDIIGRTGCWPNVPHVTFGQRYDRPAQSRAFFAALPDVVASFAGCDVLLYQAGADPHIDDPLGGWLTTEQLRLRDRIVFRECRARGIPVAWNLAGGYQRDANDSIRPVLAIHDNTMAECAAVYLDQLP